MLSTHEHDTYNVPRRFRCEFDYWVVDHGVLNESSTKVWQNVSNELITFQPMQPSLLQRDRLEMIEGAWEVAGRRVLTSPRLPGPQYSGYLRLPSSESSVTC